MVTRQVLLRLRPELVVVLALDDIAAHAVDLLHAVTSYARRRQPYCGPNDLAQLTADRAEWLDSLRAEEAGTGGGDPLAI
jgi:hypothetical protein